MVNVIRRMKANTSVYGKALYNAVVNINKNEVILDNAKELTNTFDYEKKGQALKEMYEKIIEESN